MKSRLSAEVRLPDVLEVYRLVRVVGDGSQATIAIGRHKRLHQPVAIKFSRDEESARRLLQEAAFLSRLDGLNVPSVIDDGRTPDGTAFFIMNYLEGQSLFDLIQDRGPIRDTLACARLILQIAETVAGIHDRGIIHRDLTPRNIHVGEDGVVRIVDFGLAIDIATSIASRPDLKEFHGTLAFMAPEQVNQQGGIDGRLSDVYAIGRILLFVSQGLDAVLATLSNAQEIRSSTEELITIHDPQLAQIFHDATQPDPARRTASAAELATALRGFLAAKERRQRWKRRLRHLSMAAIGGAILYLGSGLIPRREQFPPLAESPLAAAMQSVALDLAPEPLSPIIESETISLGQKILMELVKVPAGVYQRGSPAEDELADADEQPQQKVAFSQPFWMSRTEVTVAQFESFVTATGYETEAERLLSRQTALTRALVGLAGRAQTTWREPGFAQQPDHPVVNVSWNDAVAFCRWLKHAHHRNFRLPTEAEWEYACRAGTQTRFSFGNDPVWLAEWDNVAPSTTSTSPQFTTPVSRYPANPFGLHGMQGNVAEWCQDWYSADASRSRDLQTGEFRVRRGGAFNAPPEDCRCADRNGSRPNGGFPFLGFRVVDGGPISIAGTWKIVQGRSFLWSSPVTLHDDGSSSLGFGLWNYQWNGVDRLELTNQNGSKPSAFGARDADYTWDAELVDDRLELSQDKKPKLVLERIR